MENYAFGMRPAKHQVVNAIEAARKTYEGLPETVCDHRAICCKAGCPNMYYAEFLSIYQGSVEKMPKAKRVEVTMECIRRYLWPQSFEKPKPCVFLGADNMCQVYQHRPLKCRLYGLIPKTLYDWVVQAVAKDMGSEPEKNPLCEQCDRVHIKPEFRDRFPDGMIPEEMIKTLENTLRTNDVKLGIPQKMQRQGFAFLTYHDWHLMFEYGEEWMAKLSEMRLSNTDEEKEQFLSALKTLLEARMREDA